MLKRFVLFTVFVVAAAAIAAPAPARAETFDKLTWLTFSGRVQIPGTILDAGTYRFALANGMTSRNVIHVLSRDGATVYAMFHTMPASRLNVTDEATVTFRETATGVPPAIKAIFYGGEHSGYEFVYGGMLPMERAPIIPQPAVTYMPMTALESVEMPALLEFEPAVEPAIEPAVEQAPTELPKTADLVPLVALMGALSIILGIGIGMLRQHYHHWS
jgi:hypothetical protein